jgi:uncharacterized membrane protein
MSIFLAILMLVLSLLACYFPAVAGVHGRGSRKLWISLFLIGLFVGIASMMIGYHLLGTFDPVFLSQPKSESFARKMTANLLAMIVRVSLSFCIGSFLAALFYRRRQSDSSSLLGLGT